MTAHSYFHWDHYHWHLHRLRAVPLLSSLNFLPWPSPFSPGCRTSPPLPVSATPFTSTYNHAHILTTPETSSHPANTSPLPSYNLFQRHPKGGLWTGNISTAWEHTDMQFSRPPQTYQIRIPVYVCVCVAEVGWGVEGSQDLCCNMHHGWFWSTFEKHCFPHGPAGKESACYAGDTGDTGLIPGLGRIAGGGNATLSSILVWGIPWREELGRLQPLGSQRVGHDYARKPGTLPVLHTPASSPSGLPSSVPFMSDSPRLCFSIFFLLSIILSLSDLSHSEADLVMYLFKHRCE